MDFNKKVKAYQKKTELKETFNSVKDKVMKTVENTKELCKENSEAAIRRTFREGIYTIVIESVKDRIIKNAAKKQVDLYISKNMKSENTVTIQEIVMDANSEFERYFKDEYVDVLYDIIVLYFSEEEQLTVTSENNVIHIHLNIPEEKMETEDDNFELDEDLKAVEETE